MKPLFSLFFASVLSSSLLFSAESKAYPDLSKAFPTEQLFNQTKLEGIETYSYLTNREFAELKEGFSKYLGKGWEVDPEMEKFTKEAIEKKGIAMEGTSLFSNPKFPGVQIGLTQVKMELGNKKFVTSVTVIRDKVEEDGAEESATSLKPKIESNGTTKPELEARPR